MSVIHAPEGAKLDARQLLMPAVLLLGLVVFLLRLWYLQVVAAPALAERAQISGTDTRKFLAPRGRIVDRKGAVVASVQPQLVISAVPNLVRDRPDLVAQVAQMLGEDVAKLEAAIKDGTWKPYRPTPVYVGAPLAVAAAIAESPERFPGFEVSTQPMRTYADPRSLAHMLGWVWTPSAEDLERLETQGVQPADYVGKNGVERMYESVLMGRPGREEVQVDAHRRPVRSLGINHPRPGHELVLTIDLAVQQEAERALEGKKGAVVAIEPKTGEVLALVSAPTFDVMQFVGGIGVEEFRALNENPDKPLINRAVAGAYAPGSTFKIVTALACFMDPGWSPEDRVTCTGAIQMGRARFRCMGRHGSISFREALAKSCNVYFGRMALRFGPDALRHASEICHLGETLGIDLPGERRGIVPTKEYVAKNKLEWYPGNTVHFGVGQGYLALTPLQVAGIGALVANNGVLMRPHLVREWRDVQTGKITQVEKEQIGQVDGDPSKWGELHAAMRQVIDAGTAGRARIPGVVWGGKTGSAERQGGTKTHSWFVGFAPLDDPQIAIAVVAEDAGHGGEIAAPIAARLVKTYLEGRQQPGMLAASLAR